MKNYYQLRIDNLKIKNICTIYLLYIVIIIASSAIYSFVFIKSFSSHYLEENNYNIIIQKLTFAFGDLIYNLVYKNTYVQKIDGIDFYLSRHPFLPIFLTALIKISKNIWFIIITKNIITFSIYFIFCYIFLLRNKSTILLLLIVLFIPIMIPYNFSVALNFVYEDNLLVIFLPLLFLSLLANNNNKFLYVGIILFILYFIKSSVFFLVLLLPFVPIFYNYKNKFNYFPLIASLLAIITWGSFGYYKTGRFPFLKSIETINSNSLTSVYNNKFHLYYPDFTVDLLIEKTNKNFKTEWEYYDYYDSHNKKFLKNNFDQFLKDIFLKIKFIFFGIRIDGLFTDNVTNLNFINEKTENIPRYFSNGTKLKMDMPYKNPIRISSVFSKFIFNLAIIIAIFNLYKKYKTAYRAEREVYFLLIVAMYLPPLIIGWATSRHLIPISNLSLLYLIMYFKNNINFRRINTNNTLWLKYKKYFGL